MRDTVILGKPKSIRFKSIVANAELSFLAFITNFSDDFNSNWDKESVYGRQDDISSFENTTRSVSFTVDVVSSSVSEAVENFDKIKLLQRMLYPSYKTLSETNDKVISKAPLLGVYFYPLITEYSHKNKKHDFLWGTVEGVSLNPNLDEGFVFSGNERTPYPKSYELSITLSVIHRNELGWSDDGARDLSIRRIANRYAVKGKMGK